MVDRIVSCERRWRQMISKKSELILARLIKDVVEDEGCYISGINLDNLSIQVDGPDEVISNCVKAVNDIL
jgi:hypothetical protein